MPIIVRSAALLLAIMPLAGCDRGTVSNPAPERLTAPLTLPDQSSTIHIPVALPLDDLQALVNREVPRELHRIDEPEQVCIKTRSKLVPDVTCRLVGSVTRGPIRLTGKGSDILLSMPVKAEVKAQNIGKIIKQETATGAIDLTARIRLGLRPDWTPTAKVVADYDWTNRIGIDFLGQRISFASKVDPRLKAVLADLERTLPRHLAALRLKETVQPIWAKGFTSERVKSEPLIWVRFTPEQVGFAGYSVEQRRLIVNFAARARTQTIFGERPPDPPVTPLPRLMGALPATGVNVHVPVIVPYAVLERAASRALATTDYRALEIEGGTVDARVHAVRIYGTPDNKVAVGIDMALRTLAGAVSAKGTVWFVARPVLDIPGRTVGIDDLTLSGQTDSRLFNMLLAAVNATAMKQSIIDLTRYDFSRDFEEGRRKADAWLQEQPFEGFVFRGDLTGMRLLGVRVAPEGFLVEADASARASMTYDPARAAMLVAKRRAERAERLARKAAETATSAAHSATGNAMR